MKKFVLVIAALLVLGTTSAFAKGKGKSFAIGAQAGYPLGGAVTFKISSVPCVFAADFGGGYIGATADWWMANPTISGSWKYYYGAGVYGGIGGGVIAVAPRLLVGTDVYVLDNFLEFYLQAAWEPTIYVGGANGINTAWVNIPVNAGFRFWL